MSLRRTTRHHYSSISSNAGGRVLLRRGRNDEEYRPCLPPKKSTLLLESEQERRLADPWNEGDSPQFPPRGRSRLILVLVIIIKLPPAHDRSPWKGWRWPLLRALHAASGGSHVARVGVDFFNRTSRRRVRVGRSGVVETAARGANVRGRGEEIETPHLSYSMTRRGREGGGMRGGGGTPLVMRPRARRPF